MDRKCLCIYTPRYVLHMGQKSGQFKTQKSCYQTRPDDKNGPGWIGYSQHAFETLPLRTEKIKASEVLKFRDEAFDHYFRNNEYLSLIDKTFGNETVNHIKKMSSHKIPRKHHTQEVDY